MRPNPARRSLTLARILVNQVLLGTLAYTIRHDPAPFFPSEPVRLDSYLLGD
jgi:hypothetical protein